MPEDLERLAGGLLDDLTCYVCEEDFILEMSDFSEGTDVLYISDYSCAGCEAEYSIEIEDRGLNLSLRAYRIDEETVDPDDFIETDLNPDDLPEIGKSVRKEALQAQTHPVRDLVEGLVELDKALTLLLINKSRIDDACETIRATDGGFNQDDRFYSEVNTDIHNYLASAYTFEEILNTVEPNLPTEGPVESAMSTFEDEKRVVTGLRIFAQHNLTLPVSFSHFFDENTNQREVTITIDIDEIDTIDSDISRRNPDGYALGASHHYETVEGDTINIERRIRLHFEAARQLVNAIYDHANDIRGDELEDYHTLTRIT